MIQYTGTHAIAAVETSPLHQKHTRSTCDSAITFLCPRFPLPILMQRLMENEHIKLLNSLSKLLTCSVLINIQFLKENLL